MRKAPILAATAIIALPLLAVACAPRLVTRVASRVAPGCVYEIRAKSGGTPRLALTIDDAPDPATTPAILDTLRAHAAHATFFVITSQLDTASALDPIISRLRVEGNEIGNHMTHDRVALRLDSAEFERDVAHADSVLRAYGPTRWVRPGSGLYSSRMARAMHRDGHECALGSIYPFDAGLGWPWLSERYILAHARPGGIIILHDRGIRGRRTAIVLGRVLPILRKHGYEIVTLSELAGPPLRAR